MIFLLKSRLKKILEFKKNFSIYLLFPLTSLTFFPLSAYGITPSSTNSVTNLELDEFSHAPNNVSVDVDVNVKAISRAGFVKTTADFNNNFVSKQSKSYSQLQLYSRTNVVGRGSNYFGQGEIISKAFGEFFIPANEGFSFNYKGLLQTINIINNSSQESYKTVGKLSLTLVNQPTKDLIYNLNIANQSKPNQSTRKTISTSFQGQFKASFSQDTQVGLYATTQNQSCLHNVNNSTCNSPPSTPSTSIPFRPSTKIGGLLLLSFLIIQLVKKHIVQFSR